MKIDARSLATYRNLRGWLAFAIALLVLCLVLLNYALQPRQVARLLLDRGGRALGLQITASDDAGYQLFASPALVLRDLVVREPGAAAPLLRVRRIYVSLPWSTIRSRGDELAATRLELDQPVLDLPALQHWLATRPPSGKRLPSLSQGLRIRDGRIVNGDASGNPWSIDGIDVDLPLLAPDQPMHARLRGRYLDAPLAIPAGLAVAIVRPGALIDGKATGFAVAGNVRIDRAGDWRLPATVILSGPLTVDADGLRIGPARLGAVARVESGNTRLSFSLGLHGPLRFDGTTWSLAPARLVLRGRGTDATSDLVPALDAGGAFALGQRLSLRLDGNIDSWPAAWPALPPPISQSRSPLPFALGYIGAPDLSQVARLQLRRDDSRFDGRFRLGDIDRWISDDNILSPLPPLDGKLVAPSLEIAGARLQGIQIDIEDPGVPPAEAGPDAPHDLPGHDGPGQD